MSAGRRNLLRSRAIGVRRAGAALVTNTLRHALEEWKLAPAERHELLQNAKSVEIQTNGLVPTGSTLWLISQ